MPALIKRNGLALKNPNRTNGMRIGPRVLSATLFGLVLSTAMEMNAALAEDESWMQTHAGCTGTPPFIESLIDRKNPETRPLLKIGSMQAWAIRDHEGKPATALTTQDGLTIIGRIIGPQGEDISAALLATVPNPVAGIAAGKDGVESKRSVSPALNQLRNARKPGSILDLKPDEAVPPSGAFSTPDDKSATAPLVRSPAAAPITAVQEPSANIQAGIDAIFKQAGDERIWFSAGTPKPGAPVVYMLADPECPHCQWTIDKMQTQITGGSIDLRIIFAPITGVAGFNASLSILHSKDIPQTFMAHMTSKTRGTEAVVAMDTDKADRNVVQGIVDNINWMRANKMPGVPFFLYRTDQGAKFAFSELPANILTVARVGNGNP